MKKLLSIIPILIVTALLITPFSVRADVVITKEQIKGIKQLEADYKNTLSTKDEALLDQKYLAVLTACAQLGVQLYELTEKTISTNVSSKEDLTCFPAKVSPIVAVGYGAPAEPSDLISKRVGRRSYYVSSTPVASLQTRINALGLYDNTPDITTESYNKTIKQEIDAQNADEQGVFSAIVSGLINAVGMILVSTLAAIATMSMQMLDWCVSYTTSARMPNIVTTAWVVVRDFMNIFFILALIVMALATILRYESYDYRNILRRLVIMAILVNFSLLIATVLADFSDMLIALFAPKNSFIEYAKLINAGFVSGDNSLSGWFGVYSGVLGTTGEIISKVIGLTIVTIALLAISAMMFVRMIGIWFLIMISPVAYALNILPITQQYAMGWWRQFIKYLVWGPVAMFFFAIAATLMRQNAHAVIANEVLNSLFISAFVWAGFLVAKASGMAGSSAVVSGAQSALNKAKGYGMYMAKGSGRFAGNYLWRGTAAGHLAGAAGYTVGQFRGDKDLTKRAKDWHDKAKGAVGGATAKVQNIPGNFEQKWIKNPQEDRDKIVNAERRRMQIKRGYFNLDEDAAKKLSQKDFAYAVEMGNANEEFLLGAIKNGSKDTRAAIARAMSEGLIEKQKLKPQQISNIFKELKERSWRDVGGRKTDTPEYRNFMGAEYPIPEAGIPDDVVNTRRQAFRDNLKKYVDVTKKDPDKYKEGAGFSERVKNSYTRITDPDAAVRRRESDRNNEPEILGPDGRPARGE